MKFLLTVLTCIGMLVLIGCGNGASKPSGTLTGKVTYNGNPISEGDVCLYSESASSGATGAIQSGGSYSVTTADGGLPPGNYAVYVVPPTVQFPDSDEGPGGEGFKEVDNIPEKYRSASSSGLTVTIAEGSNTLDIEMSDE